MKMKRLKVKFHLVLVCLFVLVCWNVQAKAIIENSNEGVTATSVNNAALAEAKYERLMRIFINRIKLAFTETEDAKTLEILNQLSQQFNQQSAGIKNELAAS